jgi:hypothetical protein
VHFVKEYPEVFQKILAAEAPAKTPEPTAAAA